MRVTHVCMYVCMCVSVCPHNELATLLVHACRLKRHGFVAGDLPRLFRQYVPWLTSDSERPRAEWPFKEI